MKNTRLDHIYRIALGMLLYPMASSSFAQTAQAIQLGPFDLLPSLVIEHLEDDNLYQSSGENTVSTGITTIYPTIELLFDNGVSGFSLAYTLENATFSDERAESEDYTDERVDLTVGTLVADLHRFEATGSYIESHDRQSVDEDIVGGDDEDTDSDVENISQNELDTFEDVDYEIGYTLGAEGSLFNFGLAAGQFERTYVSNRAVTAAFDRKESRFITSFLWNVSPGLSAGISYFDTEIEYEDTATDNERGGDQQVTALDIVWDPLDTLNIELSVGQTDRTLDATDETNSSDYWNVIVEWNMLSYSTLSAFSSSFTDEAQAADVSFSVREEVGFSWEHDWSERFETEVAYVDSTISYESDGSPREDRSDEYNLRAAYQLRSWVNLAVFYQEIVRSSSSLGEDYDQKIYGISALFQL